jgi:hypothetical protein
VPIWNFQVQIGESHSTEIVTIDSYEFEDTEVNLPTLLIGRAHLFTYNWGGQRNYDDINKPFISTAAGPVYFTSWKDSGNMATQQVNSIVHDKPDANTFCVPTVKKCRELNSILGSISEHESGIFDQSIRGIRSVKHVEQ